MKTNVVALTIIASMLFSGVVVSADNGQGVAESLADQYIASHSSSHLIGGVERARADFIHYFQKGYFEPDGRIAAGPEVSISGYQAGQQYRLSHPKELQQTMESFGFKQFDANGTWAQGFEVSEFIPRGHPDSSYWLSILGGSPASHVTTSTGCQKVHVVGYVSPEGKYGQLGMYRQVIYAYELHCES